MISQVTTIHVYLRFDRNDMLTKLRCDRNVVDLMHASLIHHLSQRTEEDNESCSRQPHVYKYSAKRWKRSKSAEVTASYRTLRCTCSVVFLLFWALSFALSFVLSLALPIKMPRSSSRLFPRVAATHHPLLRSLPPRHSPPNHWPSIIWTWWSPQSPWDHVVACD